MRYLLDKTNKVRQYSDSSLTVAYFLYWFAAAAFIPNLSMYYESSGYSGKQIGLLIGIPYLATSISSLSLGYLSDALRRPIWILRLCSIGFVSAIVLLSMAENLLMTAFACATYAIFSAPINPILDGITLISLEDPSRYGRIRIGGSFGWGLGILGIGFLLTGWNHCAMFFVAGITSILFFMNSFFIPDKKTTNKPTRLNPNNIWRFIKRRTSLILLIANIVWGISESCITGYLFLHINKLGGNSLTMSFSMATAILSEIVCFSFVDQLINKSKLSTMVIYSYMLQFIRLCSLVLIKNPVLLVLFQFCGGASFALIWSASVAYINTHVEKELQAAGQALKSVSMSIGSSICVFSAGYLYEVSGTTSIYFWMALITLLALITGFYVKFRTKSKSAATQ
jgi:PPP family 3-phenylpropionic acid transporter